MIGDRRNATRFGVRGFTLVEMLVTVTIIGILAAATLAVLAAARDTARKAKTRTTIAKLDAIILSRYESYLSRRLPLSQDDMAMMAVQVGWVSATSNMTPFVAARVRLSAIRDLVRLEMPDRWSDVPNRDGENDATKNPTAPLFLYRIDPATKNTLKAIPVSLSERYRQAFNLAYKRTGDLGKCKGYGGAECLYDDEVGDIDGDGLNEFHDAWGRPIRFIRWPVGFVDYPNLYRHNNTGGSAEPPAGRTGGPTLPWGDDPTKFSDPKDIPPGGPSAIQSGNATLQPDPFDPMGIMPRLIDSGDPVTGTKLPENRRNYLVYPLIYSAGPDGRSDINEGDTDFVYTYDPDYKDLNPFQSGEGGADNSGRKRRYMGQPLDVSASLLNEIANDRLEHDDNIHNHGIEN
jgi:prepilin-type N-terminal cleavage/methylation domain-containing protein